MGAYFAFKLTDSTDPNWGPEILMIARANTGVINLWRIFGLNPAGGIDPTKKIAEGNFGQMRADGLKLWEKRSMDGIFGSNLLGILGIKSFEALDQRTAYDFTDNHQKKRQAQFMAAEAAPQLGYMMGAGTA